MIFLDANPLIALVDKLWTYDSEFRVVWRRRTALGSRWLSRNGDLYEPGRASWRLSGERVKTKPTTKT